MDRLKMWLIEILNERRGEMNAAIKQQKDIFEQHYQEWKLLILTGKIDTTLRPTKRFISKKDFVKGIQNIQAQATYWLSRGCNDGFIEKNPDWTHADCRKKKYLLVDNREVI